MSKIYSIEEVAKLNNSTLSLKDEMSFINYLDTSSLTKNKIDQVQNLSENFPSRAKRKVRENTILYSTVRPNQEHYGIIERIQYENLIVSTGFTTIDVFAKDIDAKYLYYKLTQPGVTKYLQNIAENSTSAYPSIRPEEIGKLNFRFPDLPTQQNIASVLSSLDNKIELNNKINAELEAMAKTLYDYWFVQFDFPDTNGKPYKSSGGKMVWNETVKREIPDGWEVCCLSDIANITMGQSPPGESYNGDGNGCVFYQGSTDFGSRYPTIRKFTTSPSRFARHGDILLSVRAPVGTMNIAKEDCCIGRGLAALNSKENCMSYLYEVMIDLKQIFDRRNVNGTTFGSITKDDLFSLKVVRPSSKILEKYNTITRPCFEKQNKMGEENQELVQLRDWLLPMLMNGQVTVGEAEEKMGMVAEASVSYMKC